MKQIGIGTCVPGTSAEKWLPHLVKEGFECVAINFHMSLEGMDLKKLAESVMPILKENNVRVSSVGYYCNPIENADHVKTLKYCMDSAKYFDAPMVTTFAGGYEGQPVEKAIPKFGEVFRELADYAADKNLQLAIENCPMGGTWQRVTCNIAFNPKAWEMMFEEVPAKNLGLEWEPGHQSIQLIDPIAQLREWASTGRILHLHGKDCSVDLEAVKKYGVFGAVDFAPQRTPGFGDTDWRQIFSILHQNGYENDVCIEGYHDPVYSGEWEMTAQLHSLRYLKWCRGGDFVPNPWDC
mgnify:FL=1